MRRHAEEVENRRRPVSRKEIEAKPASKTHPVLALEGIVNGHNFELVMRGYTNYFLKETWGADRGQFGLLGRQKPGGYSVVIRTKGFSGQWHYGWQGSHGGGGGGGFDESQGDLQPGRWLWNQRGLAGASCDYEYHYVTDSGFNPLEWQEEYSRCRRLEGILIPTRIAWHMGGRYWRKDRLTDVTYEVRSFKLQHEPSEAWFAAQVKKYIPSHAHFTVTNRSASVSTNNVLGPRHE